MKLTVTSTKKEVSTYAYHLVIGFLVNLVTFQWCHTIIGFLNLVDQIVHHAADFQLFVWVPVVYLLEMQGEQ